MNLFELHEYIISQYPIVSLIYYILVWMFFQKDYRPSWEEIKRGRNMSKLINMFLWVFLMYLSINSLFSDKIIKLDLVAQIYFLTTIFIWIIYFYGKIKNLYNTNS